MHPGQRQPWQNAFVRRQRPGDEVRTNRWGVTILECIRACERDRRCFDARCVCSAADNDYLAGCIEYDCGTTAYRNYRADLIAECPAAFDYNRRAGAPQPRPSSTSTPAPAPRPTPSADRPPPRPAPPAPSTTTTPAPQPPAEPTPVPSPAPPPEPTPSPDGESPAETSALPVESQISSDSVPAEIPSSRESADPSSLADSNVTPTSPPVQSATDSETTGGESSEEAESRFSSLRAEQSANGSSLRTSVSSGIASLDPLDPSTPGEVNKLSAGIIAGIVILILAVIAIFLAFWYRSYRRRRRVSTASLDVTSPMRSTHDGPSGSDTWMQFGGAKGSMISSYEEASEKGAPIHGMFSRRVLPSSPMMSPIRRGQSLSSAGRSSSRNPSNNSSRRSSGWGMFNMRPKWMEGAHSPPPSYPLTSTESHDAPAPAYKRPPATSFFARLLGNPVERKTVRPIYTGPELPHPHFNAPQPFNQNLHPLHEEDEPRHSESHGDLSVAHHQSYASEDTDDNLVAPHPSPAPVRKAPIDSIYTEKNSSPSLGRPSFAWSSRSLPRDLSAFEEGEDSPDMRATSTRAPSLDLAWVTQGGQTRIPVPSWAAPRRRPSMRSKKSSRSAYSRSLYRQSAVSVMSGSSGPSRSAHSSTGPIPDMPHFSSIPSFRLEIGADRAKAILQLLINTPTSPSPPEHADEHGQKHARDHVHMHGHERARSDLSGDESRPTSIIDDASFTPNLRDSASSD